MAVDGTEAEEVVSDTLTLNLRPATCPSMPGTGMVYRKELAVPEAAAELKLWPAIWRPENRHAHHSTS